MVWIILGCVVWLVLTVAYVRRRDRGQPPRVDEYDWQ
jgi:hypothetical protein